MNKHVILFILLQLIIEHPFTQDIHTIFPPKVPMKYTQYTANYFTIFPRADLHLYYSRLRQDQNKISY
jgi:hypothetical protein